MASGAPRNQWGLFLSVFRARCAVEGIVRACDSLKMEKLITDFEPPRLVIFDCDGTLVDSQHHIVAAMHSAFGAHGLVLPEAERVRRTVGLPLATAIESLLPPGGPTLAAVVESYKQAAIAQRLVPDHCEPLFPGLVETLDRLETAGFLLGIATGKARRGLDFTLATHNLVGRFVTLQTNDVVAAGKPAPDMVLQAMAETGAVPVSTVVVGDTTYDIEMARNAGVPAIGVAWGYHDEDVLWDAGASHIINGFHELPDLVNKMMGGAICAR